MTEFILSKRILQKEDVLNTLAPDDMGYQQFIHYIFPKECKFPGARLLAEGIEIHCLHKAGGTKSDPSRTEKLFFIRPGREFKINVRETPFPVIYTICPINLWDGELTYLSAVVSRPTNTTGLLHAKTKEMMDYIEQGGYAVSIEQDPTGPLNKIYMEHDKIMIGKGILYKGSLNPNQKFYLLPEYEND